jgi:hypothetical protein
MSATVAGTGSSPRPRRSTTSAQKSAKSVVLGTANGSASSFVRPVAEA